MTVTNDDLARALAGRAMINPDIVICNGHATCGCLVQQSDGHGEYADAIYIKLCAKHTKLATPETALTKCPTMGHDAP